MKLWGTENRSPFEYLKENTMNDKAFGMIFDTMNERGLDALIVSDPFSIDYLCGILIHSGERMCALIARSDRTLRIFTSRLFLREAEDIGITCYDDTEDPTTEPAEFLSGAQRIAVDRSFSAAFLLPLMDKLSGASFVLADGIVESVRQVKSEEELRKMREASRLNDLAMEKLIPLVACGLTEKELGDELLKIYHSLGAEDFSFEPITAYGANAADPHHMNDDTKGKTGDAVVLDIGCMKDGYCSDMTRTVFIGQANELSRKIYDIVLEANRKGIEAVRPGARFCDIDRSAREHIEKAGYGEYFTHRLGHCIGRQVHEWGDVSAANENIVKEGMVFSIEPGIYLPGKVGVRIEDLVEVTSDGCRVLNHFTKDLIIAEGNDE